ncbi:MAG: efflux RND transporter periplasmic adaptor subunit [Vicinamibacterales bacterium]
MKRFAPWWPLGIAIAAGAASVAWALALDPGVPAPAIDAIVRPARIAAPGRIEARSELIDVGSGVDGVIVSVRVAEGDHVAAGQIIATIDCGDLDHERVARASNVRALREQRLRLLHGGRDDERREAEAARDAAIAEASAADAELRRANQLWSDRVISQAELEHVEAMATRARAAVDAASARMSLAARAPLDEERREIDARIVEAEAGVAALDARRQRCTVRSPIDGDVVRLHRHGGETVSLARGEPIVSVADMTRLRVRAEVEETDIDDVSVGDRAEITATAFGDRVYRGHVVQIGRLMGRKGVLTGASAEKRDRDVLDVVVELDDAVDSVPLGLRVTVLLAGQQGAIGAGR